MSFSRFVTYSALGMLMSLPAFASSLTFTSIQYDSSSLCGGICNFGTTYGFAAVNDSNEVATSFSTSPTVYYGYTYQGGTYSSPIQDGSSATSFTGINDAGIISGFDLSGSAFAGFTESGGTFSSAYKFPSNTTFTDGTPNPFTSTTTTSTYMNGLQSQDGASSEIVGFFSESGASGQTRGFVYNPNSTASTGPFSPVMCTSSATTTNPYSINDSGEVVGYCKTSSGALQEAFVYNSNTPNTAPTILSSSSLATALGDTVSAVFLTSVDDNGDLAGYYTGGANDESNGFYCTGDYTFTNCSMIDVPQVAAFNDGDNAAVNGTEILGINNEGSVVGIYTESDSSTYVFLATAATTSSVPEPGTLVLTAASILGLAAFRLRRNAVRR